MSEDLRQMARTAVGLGLEYFRWTQFLPMLFAWAFLLGAILLLSFLSFQQEGLAVLEVVASLWTRLPWLPEVESLISVREDGSMDIQEGEIRALVIRGWLGISFIGMVLGQARRWIWGPRPPRSLRRKLLLLVSGLGGAWAALLFLVLGPLGTPNETVRSVVILTIGCSVVGVISTYSLLVGTAVDRVRALLGGEAVAPEVPRF
jgi:hypothetical protein